MPNLEEKLASLSTFVRVGLCTVCVSLQRISSALKELAACLLLENLWPFQGINAPELLVSSRNIEEFVWILSLHEEDCLL